MFSTIIVHGSKFHADDIFCVAMMQIINPEIQVKRVNFVTDDMKKDQSCIICDIGYGKYDHHQLDAEMIDETHKYAACGLVYRDFGHLLFQTENYRQKFWDKYLVEIQASDNGENETPNLLSMALASFNPTWDVTSPKDWDEAFMMAVAFVKTIISNEIAKERSQMKAESLIKQAVDGAIDGHVAITDMYLPLEMYPSTPVDMVVCPSLRGGWQVLTVKTGDGTFTDKVSLPETWLKRKPKGCTFVHPAHFIASFDTKDSAVKAALSIFA